MASVQSSTCPCCGGSDIEDDHSHGVAVCTSCGTATEGGLSHHQDTIQPAATFSRCQPSREQIRVFSEKSYSALKLEKLIKETKKKAAAMKLPSSKTTICVEQAKELCRRQAVGCRGLSIEVVSATLVYIAWKNENSSVSAWDMVNTGVKPNVLIKATSKLCNQHPDLLSVSQEEPLTDERRLELRLDRFSPPVHGEERHRVLAMATEVWGMVLGVRVQDLHLRKIPVNDYCILAVALQYVRRKDLPKSEIVELAKNISMTEKTVNTRIWMIKKALVTLAARCPCLEEDVKNRVIRTQNVQRYLDRLVQNKHYLSCEMELIRDGKVNEEEIMGAERGEGEGGTKKRRPRKRARKSPVSSLQLPAAVFANGLVGDMGGEEGGEGDENLSDLDDEIEEYILTEEQVKMRKYLLSTNSDDD